jgi:organic radical activating enzyme
MPVLGIYGKCMTRLMSRETMQLALQFAEKYQLKSLDLTGGSPEMNPDFKWLVKMAKKQGLHIMNRCNPTILEEPGYEDMFHGSLTQFEWVLHSHGNAYNLNYINNLSSFVKY